MYYVICICVIYESIKGRQESSYSFNVESLNRF